MQPQIVGYLLRGNKKKTGNERKHVNYGESVVFALVNMQIIDTGCSDNVHNILRE